MVGTATGPFIPVSTPAVCQPCFVSRTLRDGAGCEALCHRALSPSALVDVVIVVVDGMADAALPLPDGSVTVHATYWALARRCQRGPRRASPGRPGQRRSQHETLRWHGGGAPF